MGHLRLKDGTAFPLNLSVGDIRDISKRSGAFSKTVTLIGNDENNNLLNHYYDVNIIAGTFDVNKLQNCQVIQNGIVILDNAYMQLVEVVKSQDSDSHNQYIEYKVLVKDSVSEFFTKLGNKTLNDINLQEIVLGGSTLTYEASEVVSSFSNTITNGYKFLMPLEVTAAKFNTKAFHPAIYAKLYFDAIFQNSGFTYEWGNQSPSVHTSNDNYFEKLIIPYNGETPTTDRTDYLVEATKASLTTTQSGLTWAEQITGFTEVTDGESIFDPTNGDYSVPLWFQNPSNVQVEVTVNYDIDLVNNDASLATRGTFPQIRTYIRTEEQGATNYSQATLYTVQAPATIAASTTVNIVSGGTRTVTLNITNLDDTDILEFYLKTQSFAVYDTSVDLDITINSSTWKILPSSDSIGYLQDIDLNDYVPKKIKQSDFIKSIFMMYNLYCEVDKSQPNKIILKHRDEYYDSGTELDWTNKLAKDKDQTLQFLPELTTKKMVVSYKDDKDDINTVYKEATNETYGQIEYTFKNEYVKGIDRKEIIFSPTPIVKSSFSAYCPALSYIPASNIRILIDGGTQDCDEYDIYDYYTGSTGIGETAQTTAPLLTHFDNPETPSFDINFATCDYYFYSELSQKTNNNLYNLYWRRTLGQIDNGKMLIAYFELLETDIQSLNLNDKIRIDNSWWHINKVIDYDANKNKLTKVELISVDEEIEFTPFSVSPTIPNKPYNPVRPIRPIKPSKPETVRPIKDIIRKNNEAKNLVSNGGLVMGINNILAPDVTEAIVIGEGKFVEENGVYAPKADFESLTVDGNTIDDSNFANTDLTLDGNRSHDTDGYDLDFLDGVSSRLLISSKVVVNNTNTNTDLQVKGQTDDNLLFVDVSTDDVGIGTNTPSKKLDVNGDLNVASGSAYYHNGTAGLSGTYTFGGGGSGDIATMTFNGGILTAVTTVP